MKQRRRLAMRLGIRLGAMALLGSMGVRAADYHVTSSETLQAALTQAASNGTADTIHVAKGYYRGNFNYQSDQPQGLTLVAEAGVTKEDVVIDGAGTGRAMNLTSAGAADLNVADLTFIRDCGGMDNAALRLSTVGGKVTVQRCQFLGSTNQLGMGLEIAAGRDAIVRDCTVRRTDYAGGGGMSISVTDGARVENSVVAGTVKNGGWGIRASSAAGQSWIAGNSVSTNHGGYAGGGIYLAGTGVVSNNVVVGNRGAGNGGGIYVEGTVTIAGNHVAGNSSAVAYGYLSGGGIYAGGTVVISNNVVLGNAADSGGGISATGQATIVDNTVMTNVSGGQLGGGIYADGTEVFIGRNLVTGNSAASGGGVYASASQVTVSDNRVIGNTALFKGGGICCEGGGTKSIGGNRVMRNHVTQPEVGYGYGGGGINAEAGTLRVFNNLVVANNAASGNFGGGAWLKPGERLELVSNTVTGNAGGAGGGVAIALGGVSEVALVHNNIIWGNAATGDGADVHLGGTGQHRECRFNLVHGIYGTWEVLGGNLDIDPRFFDPVAGDYHLRFGSPGIDAGFNEAPGLPATDLDGLARTANGLVDLGCYEFSDTEKHPADTDGNWTISEVEYSAYAAAWRNRQPWSSGPNPIPADYVTRAGYLMETGSGAYRHDGSSRPTCWKPVLP
ncbi:MAG: hypothetical protein KJ072_07910 [Verrucomicrobia bacterium]|nr:hypothetical protein [Verrucomicrobiota bacterium]